MKNIYDNNVSLIKRLARRLTILANIRLKPMGVAHAYSTFLLCLYDEDGLTQAQLCKKIGIEQPSAVRTLDRMERDNFIKREPSPTDRRVTHIYLTAKASMMQRDLLNCLSFINAIALDGLSAQDKKQLYDYLDLINNNVDNYLQNKKSES